MNGQRVAHFTAEWLAETLGSISPAWERSRPLRGWVHGCGTGEEAYSLAMILAGSGASFRLFATEPDPDLLALARRALFAEGVAAAVGPERLARHFVPAPGRGLRIADPLRRAVVFAPHHLGRDPHLTGLDLVYLPRPSFEPGEQALAVLHHALRPGGLLLLDPAAPAPLRELFAPAGGAPGLYRRGDGERDCPLHPTRRRPRARARELVDAALTRPRGHDETRVVIDREGRVLRVEGRIGRYLDRPGPAPGLLDLVGLVHPDLRVELRSLLEQARRRRAPARYHDLRLSLPPRPPVRLELHVEPLGPAPPAANLLLVRFVEPDGLADPLAGEQPAPAAPGEPEVERLRVDLGVTQAHLDASRRELEALDHELTRTHEELTLLNEELVATVDELERRQIEAERAADELEAERVEQRALQEEVARRADELERLTADLRAALESALVAAVVVDRGEQVTVLHPGGGQEPVPGDPRDSLRALEPGLEYADLVAGVQAVRRSGRPLERLLSGSGGRSFAVRLHPWPAEEGAVLVAVRAAAAETGVSDAAPSGEDDVPLAALADVLAREVRTALAAVGGALQVVGARLAPDDPDRGVMTAVEERLGALDLFVEDLLLVAGPVEPRRDPVALTELLCQAIAGEAPFGGPHRVGLDAPGDLVVPGDARLLHLLFRNLVRNAVQATPAGGRIAVLAGSEGGGCRVRVIDAGPGIPEPLRERVLTPFFTTRRNAVGLGLTVARRIARLHGGELRLLEGEGGQGLAVEVVLPG